MTAAVTQPVLVYNRIGQNRRRTWLLLSVATAAVLPLAVGIAYLFAWRFLQFAGYARQPNAGTLRLEVVLLMTPLLLAVPVLLFLELASHSKWILTLCGARPATRSEAEAQRILDNLAIGAGLPAPKLYVIDSMVPNAFAAGMDPSHALVTVTQGLLLLLDKRELEGVLAHELSHIGNRDTRLNTMVAAIALFLRLPHLLRRRAMRQRVHVGRGNPESGGFARSRLASVALLPLYIYIFAVAPALATLLRAAISRSRESLADADAALLTRYPEGLIRALAKIAGAGSLNAQANPAVSHLYFADPSAGAGRVRWFTGRLLATHPPIEDRIARLCEVNAGLPLSVLETAVKAGQEFSRNHPELPERLSTGPEATDELAALNTGNQGGKAARLKLSGAAVYEAADVKSRVLEQLRTGEFVISMNDYGGFHQIVTAHQTFGYIQRSVKLEDVDILPTEVFDPEAQKAALLAAEQKRPESGISEKHIAIAIIFGLVVFAAVIVILVILAGR